MGLSEAEGIILTLEKNEYKPGETIKGTVTLKLEKPTKAKKLEVGFIGERIEKEESSRDRGYTHAIDVRRDRGYRHTIDVRVMFYETKVQLDGKKEYFEGTYPFEIKIPSDLKSEDNSLKEFTDDANKVYNPDGKFAKLLIAAKKAQSTITGSHSWPVEWHVTAHLDIPFKLDLKGSQQIAISQ